MITVIGMWDQSWMDSKRTERKLWKQTIEAYQIDRWIMTPGARGKFTSPEMYVDIDDALSSASGIKTFLVAPKSAPDAIPLHLYTHPKDAIYVFGRTNDNLLRYATDDDDIVGIYTPYQKATMFGHAVLAAVLYDRSIK